MKLNELADWLIIFSNVLYIVVLPLGWFLYRRLKRKIIARHGPSSDRPIKGPEMRVSLNADDFQQLVKGKMIEDGPVKIVLQDIGFQLMKSAISNAYKMNP